MSDSTDAEQARQRRLAALGDIASSDSRPQNSGAASAGTSNVNSDSTLTSVGKAGANTTAQASSDRPNQGSATAMPPKVNIQPLSDAQQLSLKRGRPSPAPSKQSVDESPADWEDRVLSSIFRLTLDPGKKQDQQGNRLRFVQSVRQDLEEQEAPLNLSIAVLDQAILEAASNLGKRTPLDYLLGCWKRVTKHFKALRSKPGDPKLNVVKEARRVCMSYCIFALTLPDMFGREIETVSPLVPHLLLDSEDERGVCHDFLVEITSRFAEDETAEEAVVKAVEDISKQLATMTMNDDYKPHVSTLRNLVRYPAVVNAITQSPLFLPLDVPAATLESNTLMGPFFQLSPLQGGVTSNYFSSPKTRDKSYIINSQNALRMTLRTHQTDLLDIINHIIKTGKAPRERMLDWFARCINLNHKRRALQVDHRTVSSDGFMLNLTVCLDQLCEPFMDATFSKIDRIDVEYLRRKPRVDIKEETKLNADQNTSDSYYSTEVDGQSNFISEVFFLTLAAHHYGTEATNSTLNQMEKDLRHMEKQVAILEADRPKFASDPNKLALFDRALQKYKDQIDKGLSYKFAVQGVLLDDLTQTRSMQFMRYVIVWMMRLVDSRHEFPKRQIDLPLPESHSLVFRCLPEYFLEDIVGNFKFIMRNMPQVITATQADELVMICITFLRSSEYIKNPYLKSGLVTIMFHGIWPVYGRTKGILGDLLNSMPFAIEHLLHALMKFYIEVENTGAHTQFYDKFNIRYEIFQIIKCIWSNPIYREHLDIESKVNLEFFVRFVNLLLNDVTYVLDESLSSFKKIHDLQQQLNSDDLDPNVRTEKQELLAEAQGRAKSYMQLANETVAMLKLFTDALADSFTMPEIVQRLADMLDYNLDAMVGPKSRELKVENPEQYDFNPRVLLAEIVDVYLNLRTKENFVMAVARDGRSYKPKNFDNATQILSNYHLKSREDIAAWTSLGEKFKRAKELDQQAEEDLGEVPDEFLDPLMFTLMEDPVILPTSKQSIDRSTIRSHLLSDPNDPFNRSPLKIEDVIPDVELKQRIESFKTERKGKRLQESGIMDTSAG